MSQALLDTNIVIAFLRNDPSVREQLVRSLANLITVRSDRFTVWVIAQAIQDVNNNGVFDPGLDVIAAETKVQAVVERYVEAGQVKFRTLYFRYYAE